MSVTQEATSDPQHSASQTISLFLMINSLETGGTERQFTVLSRSLATSPFQLHLGCIRRQGPLAAEIGEIPEFWLGGNLWGWKSVAARMRLGLHLREERVQVAHAFDFYTNLTLIPAARLARIPVVIGSHRQVGDLLTGNQFRAQLLAFRACDAVVCNSQAAAQRLAAAGLREEKLVVIGNALPAAAFEVAPAALPRRPEVLRVCMVGRMNAHYKNHRGFLRIAARVRQQVRNVEFFLVGDGPLRPELEEYAKSLSVDGEVTFLGERRDMSALLASMDLAVLTSDSESLSNVILEAMAARLPVVAYNVGGNAELISNERGGRVGANDEEVFAATIVRFLANASLRQDVGVQAFHFAQANFNLEHVRRSYQDLYVGLLDRKGRKASTA